MAVFKDVMNLKNRDNHKHNSLKRRTLEIFASSGALSPPAYSLFLDFRPARASYSYLLRLHRFGLLNRSNNQGLLIYNLSERGRSRLEWLLKGSA